MSLKLIARKKEQSELQKFYDSAKPEFLAIFGRRRIGKTFLIKRFFEQKKSIFFNTTGIQKGKLVDQINRFTIELGRTFYKGIEIKKPSDWFKAFDLLNDAIEKFVSQHQKIVLFFDEFPWMVTRRSKLLTVLEYFWNQYWSNNPKIKLIICGSSASWIIKKIINNKGGLHNRITRKMQLRPFNLKESKMFLSSYGVKLNNKQVLQLYMVMGGVPYYLSLAEKGMSATQLIEKIAFQNDSLLLKEFDNLFSSLFEDKDTYIELIKIIASRRYGIEQEDIIRLSKHVSRGGRASDRLKELEEAGFIISFIPHFHKKKGIYYRITDEYILFYLRWIDPIKNSLQKSSLESGYWENEQLTPAWASWAGYAFEAVCYQHISEIRKSLSINPTAIANSWRYVPTKANKEEKGAQIDLLFDRKDDEITLCEIKHSNKPFVIDKQYAKNLINKQEVFIKNTHTKKQLFIAIITTNGLKQNLYSDDLVSCIVMLDDLFKET